MLVQVIRGTKSFDSMKIAIVILSLPAIVLAVTMAVRKPFMKWIVTYLYLKERSNAWLGGRIIRSRTNYCNLLLSQLGKDNCHARDRRNCLRCCNLDCLASHRDCGKFTARKRDRLHRRPFPSAGERELHRLCIDRLDFEWIKDSKWLGKPLPDVSSANSSSHASRQPSTSHSSSSISPE